MSLRKYCVSIIFSRSSAHNNNSESNKQETVNFSLVSWIFYIFFHNGNQHTLTHKSSTCSFSCLRTTTSIALHRSLAPQSRNSSLFFPSFAFLQPIPLVDRLSNENDSKTIKLIARTNQLEKSATKKNELASGCIQRIEEKKRTSSIILRTVHTTAFASFFGFVSAKVPLIFLLGASYAIHGRCVRAWCPSE